ncbi:hypothetical protein [Methylobacterium oxalidis]|uniref:Uncharacterized protein n=1 Tax=Methylobacterium oxalidis TaxID=944322 RepID=A0A512J391_9HYPH|nr:hypothetical protein [Methylobacterium oxalidis]GEP04424.1 hypothetical protein MOX02_24620 [Methylobacterium oxalidis]GJE35227.1 hypothetical protein LDDCCGHA_5445 [Methylobacterium oxalidis]GLS62796.1 hypothetical protein GCM10007888_11770 [Methylobacterium oxalidis]
MVQRALRFRLPTAARDRFDARSFPLSIHRVASLVEEAGFSGTAYRGQAPAFEAALPNDRSAVHHLLRACIEELHEYPLRLDLAGFAALAGAPVANRRYLAHLGSSLVNAHIAGAPGSLHDPAFWSGVLPALRRIGEPYLLVGDSHSRLYRAVGTGRLRSILPIHALCTAGSAVGLDNPQSRSGYGAHLGRIAAALAEAQPGPALPVFFQFGQVDVEFVATFRRIARAERVFDRAAFAAFADEVATRYTTFLAETFAKFEHRYVLPIFPPSLSDGTWAQGYVNAHVVQLESAEAEEEMTRRVRELEIPTLRERTELHRAFNAGLARRCRERGLRYVEVFDAFLSAEGTVAPRFIANSGGRDHHMDEPPVRPLARAALEMALRPSRLRVRGSTTSVRRPAAAL